MANSNFSIGTSFKDYYSQIISNPESNRQILIDSVLAITEKIKDLQPHTRLSFGPKGEIIPDQNLNLLRGIRGYIPAFVSNSGWSDDISNLKYWSENVLSQFAKFGIADADKICKSLREAKSGFEKLEQTYVSLGKNDQAKIVKKTIKKIDNCIGSIEHNKNQKYQDGFISSNYLKSKVEMFKIADESKKGEVFNRLASSMSGLDLTDHFKDGDSIESATYREISGLLVSGVEKKIGSANLAAELVIGLSDENTVERINTLKQDLRSLNEKAMPLQEKQVAQINLLEKSGLFSLAFDAIASKHERKAEAKQKKITEEDNKNRFWGNVGQLAAGGVAIGASVFFPAVPGMGVASGIGGKYAKDAIDDLISSWYGKKPEEKEKKQLLGQLKKLDKTFRESGPVAFYNEFQKLYGDVDKDGRETLEDMSSRVENVKKITDALLNQLK